MTSSLSRNKISQFSGYHPCETNLHRRRTRILRNLLEPSQKPKVIFPNDLWEFDKFCKVLTWNHRKGTTSWMKRQEIAERAVRRVKEETSAVILQSGSDDKWRSDPTECYYYLQNVENLLTWNLNMNEDMVNHSQDLLYYLTHWIDVVWTPRETKHEFITLTENMTEDILIIEIEKLEKKKGDRWSRKKCIKINCRRLDTNKVMIFQKDGEFVFLVPDGSTRISGRDYEFQESTLRREFTVRRENLKESHDDREVFQLEETKDDEGINKDFRTHVEDRKEFHLSSSYWSESSIFRAKRRVIPEITRFQLLNETLPRINIRYGRRNGEKPKQLRQKQIQLNMLLKGKDGILYSIATLRTNSFLWKDLKKALRLNFFEAEASKCCLASRHSVLVRQITLKIWRVQDTLKWKPVKKKVWTPNIVLFREFRESRVTKKFRRLWRSVSQTRKSRETESMCKRSFISSKCWFQMQRRQWKRNERRS